MDQLDAVLDEYERGVGLPAHLNAEVEQEARAVLNMRPAELRKLTAVQCGEYAFLLRQFAAHVQRSCNRESARIRWADESIKKVIGKSVGQYRGVSFEERKIQAVADNDAAQKLDRIRVNSALRVERLNYMATKVGDMADALKSLQFSKKGQPVD